MAIADMTGTLVAHDVEFIVTGQMAAVLQMRRFIRSIWTPCTRCPNRTTNSSNALTELDAVFRDAPASHRTARIFRAAGTSLL